MKNYKNCKSCIYYDFKDCECTLAIISKKCDKYISIFECCTNNCKTCKRKCDRND